ncbi:MAG: DNA polymerase, partial [Clostridia bacterium]|nr:DNA polymerase [Clostridia bacterium]
GLLQRTESDGRVRTKFDQTATVTGRLSSNEPNLQNIPVRTEIGREIRKAFIARDGWTLIDADYSQIELRILAHLSSDANMIDAFQSGHDIHQRTAAEVYGVSLDKVTGAMRSAAKAVNFGIVYGISEFGLARNIGVTKKEASEFIARYFMRYPGVKRFMEGAIADGKALSYATTLFGRRRPLPELFSETFTTRSFGERAAINTPVQGAAADIIKLAMIRVHRELAKGGYSARLILQVHDELIVECPAHECERATALVVRCMENVASLKVPLKVDVKAGKSWFESK